MTAGPRVVVVADAVGDLTGHQAAAEVAQGWSRTAPHVHLEVFASHGGGAGLPELVARSLDGTTHPVVVPGPLGEEVPAALTYIYGEAGTTAYLDAAQVCGRQLVPADRLADPAGLSSAGLARLLELARGSGADRIVVSVGDLATHDAGMGLLQGLGAGTDLSGLARVRQEWGSAPLVLLTPDESTLLGFHGASAMLTERHGVAPAVSQRLESETGAVTDRVNQVLPPARDLLTGLARRPEREPGSGAGGGVGYALQLLGARTDTAARFLLDELGIRPRLRGALLVLVTDAYDSSTVHDGVVAESARAALETATPTVVLAREVAVGRREGMSLGVSGSYAQRGDEGLAGLAARVARTWTPPPAPSPPTAPPPAPAPGSVP